jgi:hypothetical protein
MGGQPLKERFRAWFQRFLWLTSQEGDFEVVHVTYDPVEAEMLKDVLEGGGIDVVLRSDKVSPFPVNVGKVGEMKLLVPKESAEAARELIASFGGNNETPS